MKQIYSKILMLVAMVLMGGSVWADEVKFTFKTDTDITYEKEGTSGGGANCVVSKTGVTLAGTDAYTASGKTLNVYKKSTFTVTAPGNITKIDLEYNGKVYMFDEAVGDGKVGEKYGTSGSHVASYVPETLAKSITLNNPNGGKTELLSITITYAPTAKVNVTGVVLDKTTAEVLEGKTTTLTATVNPADATNKKISWTSDNTSVATVLNGVITGVTPGKANITVTTEDGNFTATCAVTVKEFVIPDEFTFLFTPNGTDSDNSNAYAADAAKVFTEGSEYVKSVTLDKVYPARNSLVNGAKFGMSSAVGTITINLEKPVYVEKVIVSAALYGDSEGQDGFTVNGKAVSMASGKNKVYADYEIDMDNDEISSITITQSKASKGRIYVKSIKVVQAKIEITPEYLAARESLLEEIDKAKSILNYASRYVGVNVFMYSQGAYKKFCKKIEEIEGKVNKYPNELAIYDAIDQVRNAQREFRPIFRGVNADYAIKHIESGLYLNISEDGVTLAEEPTPINFHNLLYEPELHIEQYKECGFQILHSGYLYNTPERKYLGAEWEEVQYEEGEDTWTEYELVLQPNKLRQWYIMVTGDNTYGIFIREDYETPNGKFSEFRPLVGMPEYDEETQEITSYFPCISYMQGLNNPDEWFIEDYVAPTFDVPTEKEGEYAEEATSIAGASTAVTPVAYFTANGAQLKSAQKGLNIVKMSDNSVRKIFVK